MSNEVPTNLEAATTGFPGLDPTTSVVNGISGVFHRRLVGRQGNLGGSTLTVWSPSTAFVALTAAVAHEVVSTSANDASAGTGARTVRVQYLDSNFAVQHENVTLNGTTPVAMTGTPIAVNSIFVLTAGSGLTNAGQVSVRTVSGSVIKNAAGAGYAEGSAMVYTIPAGYVGIIKNLSIGTIATTGNVQAHLYQTSNLTGIKTTKWSSGVALDNTLFNGGVVPSDLGDGIVIPEKHSIDLQGLVDAGGATMYASADLYLLKRGSCPWVG